jgi:LysR family transcriptional regulator, nitrogen assimilation regulatory protein
MELRQLRYFVGVSDAGSLLKASRTLHVAQPALSQHMAALEAELRTTLFQRSSRGMALTDSGRRFLEHARVVLADVERARNSVQGGEQDFAGEVSIGLPTTVALVATLPILRAVRERFPRILPRLVESHSGYLREWLQAGRLDLSVLFAMEQQAWLLQKPILSEKLCLIGPRGKRARLPATLPLRQLGAYQLLLPGRDHGLRRIIDEACAQHDVKLDVVGEIDSLPNIKKAVEAGVAFTVLSPGAVAEEVALGRLESATLRSPTLARTIVCATSLTRPLTPAAAAVDALVCERLQDLVLEGHWPATLQRA